jgi:cyclopropane-fatty-acyl-phospholipid synthase
LLLQAITLTGPKPVANWRKFITYYVFPDGRSRPVSTVAREGENAGLEVRDVESLREHYAATLKCWLSSLELRHDEATQACNESTYRAFRLYLAGAAYGYIDAIYNVHQTLFVKPDNGRSGYPLTRAQWYQDREAAAAPALQS